MKTNLLCYSIIILIVSALLLFSCKKDEGVKFKGLTTTTFDIKTDSTAVTLSLATQLALHFLQSKNPSIVVTIKSAETIIKNGILYFHIINANDNAGFVIFSTDSIYAPLLAYDSIGNFDKNNLNPGLVMWLNKQ